MLTPALVFEQNTLLLPVYLRRSAGSALIGFANQAGAFGHDALMLSRWQWDMMNTAWTPQHHYVVITKRALLAQASRYKKGTRFVTIPRILSETTFYHLPVVRAGVGFNDPIAPGLTPAEKKAHCPVMSFIRRDKEEQELENWDGAAFDLDISCSVAAAVLPTVRRTSTRTRLTTEGRGGF